MFNSKLRHAAAALLALISASALNAPAHAKSYPEYVRTACKADFKKFCRPYDEESAALRQCMRRAADDLSRKCQDALERSGERRGGRR